MKKLALLIFLSANLTAYAQEESKDFVVPKALLKLYPQGFFVNTLQLGIEAFNSSHSRSFNLDLGVRTKNDNWDSRYFGFYGDIAYRKYFVPMKLTDHITRKYYMGVYYSVGIKSGFYQTEAYDNFYGNSTETELWSFSPYFTIGLQRTFWEVVYLDIFLGGGIGIPVYGDTSVEVSSPDIFEPAFKGVFPKIGVKIGVGL